MNNHTPIISKNTVIPAIGRDLLRAFRTVLKEGKKHTLSLRARYERGNLLAMHGEQAQLRDYQWYNLFFKVLMNSLRSVVFVPRNDSFFRVSGNLERAFGTVIFCFF